MATSVGAASTAAIAGTVTAGLIAGLSIGDQFNTSLAEGGSGTLKDWWKTSGSSLFGLRQSNLERELAAKEAEFKLNMARQRGYSSYEEMARANESRRTRANDLISTPGYGERTLVTPKGEFALNNSDTVMAGTNLFNKGELQVSTPTYTGQTETINLIRKVDQLVSMLSNATTTINVGGSVQRVPRMQLVGVYSRNEVV